MSRVRDLESYIDGVFAAITGASDTYGLPPIFRLEAQDFNLLPSPGIGLLLTVPLVQPQDILASGETALWDWGVTVYCCAAPGIGTREGRITATELAETVHGIIMIDRSCARLRPAPDGIIDYVMNDATSTIASLNYVLNWPL